MGKSPLKTKQATEAEPLLLKMAHQRLRRNMVLDSRGMPMIPKSRTHREYAVTSTALRLEKMENQSNHIRHDLS